jgi:hypothetical protein
VPGLIWLHFGSNGSYLHLTPLAERELSPQVMLGLREGARGGGGPGQEEVQGLRADDSRLRAAAGQEKARGRRSERRGLPVPQVLRLRGGQRGITPHLWSVAWR